MSKQKIVIAGGSGFIGKALVNYFSKSDTHITILSRTPKASAIANVSYVVWDGQTAGDWYSEIDGAQVVINLTGKSVNCRFTEKNKKEILSSRIMATRAIANAIEASKNPPSLWINASATGIYQANVADTFTETHNRIGTDFFGEVCTEWENELFNSATTTRKIALRTGVVLGSEDGFYPAVAPLVKLGLGGQQGNGKQFISWIHITDIVRIIDWCIKTTSVQGAINAVGPEPLDNKTFMQTFRNVLNMHFGIPQPAFLIRIGSFFLGTEANLVLESRKVYPETLMNIGFSFLFPTAEAALGNLSTT